MNDRLFEFRFLVADDPRDFEDWANALYDAGGDDTSPGISNGQPYVRVHREAATLEEAIRSARDTVQAAGLRIIQCEIPADVVAALPE